MTGLPLFTQTAKFTAVGFADVFTDYESGRMERMPSKWSIQVTGVSSTGANIAATSWIVTLQSSNDGIGHDSDAAALLTHSGPATNPDGSVVDNGAKPGQPRRFVRIHCQALTIAPADHILVTVVGRD